MQGGKLSICAYITVRTMWYIQLTENYSVIKRNKGPIHATAWMCKSHSVDVEVKDNLQEWVLSLNHVGLRDQTQAWQQVPILSEPSFQAPNYTHTCTHTDTHPGWP